MDLEEARGRFAFIQGAVEETIEELDVEDAILMGRLNELVDDLNNVTCRIDSIQTGNSTKLSDTKAEKARRAKPLDAEKA